MSAPFTSIDNPSAWQVNFDDAGFAGAFASGATPAAAPSAGPGDGGFADFGSVLGGGGDMAAHTYPAHAPASTGTVAVQQPHWSAGFPDGAGGGSVVAPGQTQASFGQASWAQRAPSPSLGRLDGSAVAAPQQQLVPMSAPVSSSAPRVHIRSASEVSGPTVADLCSLAPPPPVANRQQKTSVGLEGSGSAITISRHRPGTERGPRPRRHSSVDDDGPYIPTEQERQRRQPGRTGMATSQSFELPSPNRSHSDSTGSPQDWSGFPGGSVGSAGIVGSGGLGMLQPEPTGSWSMDPAPASVTSHFSLLDDSLPTSGLSAALSPVTDSGATAATVAAVPYPSAQSVVESPPVTQDPMAALQQLARSKPTQLDAAAQSQPSDEWTISPPQQEYYESQFRNLAENQEVVTGTKARGFFLKSRLPAAELSQIWRLSDVDGDGALNSIEFCIAMQLVFARRRAIDLPDSLPASLIQFRRDSMAATSSSVASGSGSSNVAAPSPSQMPLLARTPEPSDSDSEDEPAVLSATVTDGSAWQGSTLSTEADGKPPLRPKPGAAAVAAVGSKVPERPSHPPRRPQASPASPLQHVSRGTAPPRRAVSDVRLPVVAAAAAAKPVRPQPRSTTLGRHMMQPLESDRSSTEWSTAAGDLLGRHEVMPGPAPRIPKRTNSTHHRGGSIGDPRLMATITSDFSPSLPPREKQPSEAKSVETRSPLQATGAGGELESLLEGRASEMKKKLESKEDSPVHRPNAAAHSILVADGTVAATAAGLAHVIHQGASMGRPVPRSSERKLMEARNTTSEPSIAPTPVSPVATINRRVVKKPDRPAAPVPKATPADSTPAEGARPSSTDNVAEENIYASAVPRSKRGYGSGVAAFGDRVDSSHDLPTEHVEGEDFASGSSIKSKISKCRDQLLALSAVNQELQTELYQARERRLTLQYELERLQGGQLS